MQRDQALRALGWRAADGDREQWVRAHTIEKLGRWISEAGLAAGTVKLADVLRIAADKLRVSLVHVASDVELDAVVDKYAVREEPGLAALAHELRGNVEAGIVRLRTAKPWERPLLALIDARGERAASQVFSACHEVAHALLEPQLKLDFRCRVGAVDPLERVVDVIAGEIAFFDPIARAMLLEETKGELTVSGVESFRVRANVASSRASAFAAAVRLWPAPAVWLVARPRAAKDGRDAHAPPLRVETCGQNALAKATDLATPPNYRVPESSVIHRAFTEASAVSSEATENMASWRTSAGEVRPPRMARVSARRVGPVVFAVVVAAGLQRRGRPST